MKTRIRCMLIAVALLPLAPAVALAGFCFDVTGLPGPAALNLTPLPPSPDGRIEVVGEAHGVCGPDAPPSAVRGTVTGDGDGVGHLALRFLSSGPGCSGGEVDVVLAPPYEAGTGQVRLPEGSVANVVLTQDPTGGACVASAAGDPFQPRPTLPVIGNPRTSTGSFSSSSFGVPPFSQSSGCVPGATTLCLQGNRFRVNANKLRPGQFKAGQVSSVTFESGLFYFVSSSNVELLVKVLNGCSLNGKYHVFVSPLTDIRYTVTVTDTQAGRVRTYFNPLGNPAAPIEDTSAFATCP